MKRIFALLLALMMALPLAACGSGNGGGNGGNSNNNSGGSQDGDEALRAGVFWSASDGAFLSDVREAVDAGLEAAGIDCRDFDANGGLAAQVDQVRDAVADGVGLVIVSPAAAGAADAPQQLLEAAGGVPVIFFGRAAAVDGGNACFIGSDPAEIGRVQGQMIGEYLAENYDVTDLNGDGEIAYAMFTGGRDDEEALCRARYSVDTANAVLEANDLPALVYFNAGIPDKAQPDPDGTWSGEAAQAAMGADLAEYNRDSGSMIELVIAGSDDMALGAVSALNEAGWNLNDGSGLAVPVFGVDAAEAAVEAMAAGGMAGSVRQDAQAIADAVAGVAKAVGEGSALADAVAAVADSGDRYSVAGDAANRLYVACAPCTP